MRLTASTANEQGVTLSVEKLTHSINDCKKVMGKSLFKLYDRGYISSPTVYDEKSAKKALVQEFPADINYLCSNIDGNFNLSSLRIKFANKFSRNEDFKEVTSILHDYYKSVEDLEALEKTLSCIISKKENLVTVNPKISVSESVIMFRCPLRLDNEAVRKCLYVEDGYKLETYNLSHLVSFSLCNILGFNEEVYVSHKESNKAIFIDGATFEEELEFIPLLITGELNLPTVNGEVLSQGVLDYYKEIRDEKSVVYGRITFEAKVYLNSFKSKMTYVNSLRESLSKQGGTSYMLSQEEVLFKVKSNTSTGNSEDFNWNIIGNYVLDWVSHEELSKANNLLGYSGEFVSEDSLRSLDCVKSGVPTMLKVLREVNGEVLVTDKAYYNINQLTFRDGTSLKALMGSEYEFVFTDINEVYSKFGVSDSNELLNYITNNFRGTVNVDCSSDYFSNLVSDLTLALIMMDCGYSDYEPYFTDKSNLSSDIFYKACYEAEALFKKLDF